VAEAKKCHSCGKPMSDQGKVILPSAIDINRQTGGTIYTAHNQIEARVFLCNSCGRLDLYNAGRVSDHPRIRRAVR